MTLVHRRRLNIPSPDVPTKSFVKSKIDSADNGNQYINFGATSAYKDVSSEWKSNLKVLHAFTG